jgi:hypothetical protein
MCDECIEIMNGITVESGYMVLNLIYANIHKMRKKAGMKTK